MTIKDAFALAFDKSVSKKDLGDTVHLSYKFKVNQYKRGEQGSDDSPDSKDKKKDSVDNIAADSIDTARGFLAAALSSHESMAMDKDPVKTPLSECKAKNPMRCKYHGQAVMTSVLNKLLDDFGVAHGGVSISRLDDMGSYQLDVDVSSYDVDKAKKAISHFGTMDGITLEDDSIENDHGKIEALYEIDELDPDDEFLDEDEDGGESEEDKGESSSDDDKKDDDKKDVEEEKKEDGESIKKAFELLASADTPKEDGTKGDDGSPKDDKEGSVEKPEESKPTRKKVDAVGLLLESSKRITGAAKSINRSIDRGSFTPRESRIESAEEMRSPLTAMSKAAELPYDFKSRAAELISSLDAIKKSKEGGYKDRIADVPYFDEDHFRAVGEKYGMTIAPKEDRPSGGHSERHSRTDKSTETPPEKKDEKKDDYEPPKSIAEGVMKIDEATKSVDYLKGIMKDADISASLRAELDGDLKEEMERLSRYEKDTDAIRAKEEAEEKARKEAEKKASEEKSTEEGESGGDESEGSEGDAETKDAPKTRKPRAKKGVVATDTKLVMGKSTTIMDGDNGKEINKRREAAGLAPLEALKHIDTKVAKKTENFRLATKKMAEEYGDPDLDISDPEVFATVQKNWAETVKSIANEGQFCSFCEPDDVLAFLGDGHYRTHLGAGRMANLSHSYGISRSHSDEAAISSILCPSDSDRKFDTNCSNRFGPLCIEWKKDGNLVPCFSNCDADEPANQDRARGGDYIYNPSLVSNPSICSLSAFCKGLDPITTAVGYKSPTGKKETSWMNALKVLRKGPIKGDAKDFDTVVNGEDKWRSGLDLFGWNEAPLLGHGTTADVAALHFNTKKWKEMRSSAWTHGTSSYSSASDFIETLKKSRGSILKEKGIKIILDGKEVPLD